MKEYFTTDGASTQEIASIAEWVKTTLGSNAIERFDVLKFVEIDLQSIFPGIYLHVLPNIEMEGRHAFLCPSNTGIVVSETIYEAAGNGCLFSCEKILHEVGHLFLHSNYTKAELNSAPSQNYERDFLDMKPYESVEWQATEFAKCFLYSSDKVPPESYLAAAFLFSEKQLKRASKHFAKVSRNRHRRTKKTVNWVKFKIDQSQKSWRTAQAMQFIGNLPAIYSKECKQLSLFR